MRELMTAGPFRRIFASLASGRPTGPSGDALDRERARRLRQFPEGRVEARRLLETILSENPDDPETLRELGAWWLGGAEDPKTRAQAVAALAKAQADPSAVVLLALVRSDSAALGRADHSSYRFRLARAILASRGRPAGSGRDRPVLRSERPATRPPEGRGPEPNRTAAVTSGRSGYPSCLSEGCRRRSPM